jgi:hypothetical protein
MTIKQKILTQRTQSKKGATTFLVIMVILGILPQFFKLNFSVILLFSFVIAFIFILWIVFKTPKPLFCPNCDHNFNLDILKKTKEELQDYNFCPKCSLDLNEETKTRTKRST